MIDEERRHWLREMHVAAIGSNSPNTDRAAASIMYAVRLALDFDVTREEMTPSCRALIVAHDTARLLTEAGIYTRWAAEVGGALYRWHVTGLGEVDTSAMVAHGESVGVRSRWADSTPAGDRATETSCPAGLT